MRGISSHSIGASGSSAALLVLILWDDQVLLVVAWSACSCEALFHCTQNGKEKALDNNSMIASASVALCFDYYGAESLSLG